MRGKIKAGKKLMGQGGPAEIRVMRWFRCPAEVSGPRETMFDRKGDPCTAPAHGWEKGREKRNWVHDGRRGVGGSSGIDINENEKEAKNLSQQSRRKREFELKVFQ